MVRSTRASRCPDLPDDRLESAATRSYDEIATILAREGRPMTVKQVARLCGSAERKFVRALSADMEWLALVTDTAPMRKAIEPTRMNHETL